MKYSTGLTFLLFVFSRIAVAAVPTPNVILLVVDDLGYGELGCQGNHEIPTPHIDSIAQHGIQYTQGYVTAPNCSPSRAGMLTGRMQTRFGYEFNPVGAKNDDPTIGVPTNQRTIANVLHDSGYTTSLIGKWHLGSSAVFHPQRRGFDEFFGFLHEGHYFVPLPWQGVTTYLRRKALPGGGEGRWIGDHLIYSNQLKIDEPAYDTSNPLLRSSQPVDERENLTDAFTREAVNFIGRNKDKPFYLHLAYNAVHSPLQGPDAYMEKLGHIEDAQRRIFLAMLANLDDSVGAILKKLREEHLEENTLVIFISDNGGPTRETTARNSTLRGEKMDMYEGGLRVPFLMQWKGTLPEASVYKHPVSSLDIMPTVAVITDAKVPKDLDGVNLLPYLTGKNNEPPHDLLFWRQGARAALRKGDWKLVRMPDRKSNDAPWELYNLADDMEEAFNQAEKKPEKFQELKRLWEKLDAEMVKPLF
ncbi:N-acetylgalactosamine-6-sulfatase [soil metagenome]